MPEESERKFTTALEDVMRKSDPQMRSITRQFRMAAFRARAGLFWEAFWPRAVPVLCTGGLFISASWATGMWVGVPVSVRIAGVLATTFAAVAAASPLVVKARSLKVSKDEALKRLDDISGDPLRPAQTFGDQPSERSSQVDKELWKMHIVRMWNRAGGTFRSGFPHPGVPARDPYRLRYIVAGLVAASALIAGEKREERLMAAFDWSGISSVAEAMQIKAWVTPPDNISIPPLYMTEDTRDDTQGGQKLVAHKNSTLLIRTYGIQPKITINGTTLNSKPDEESAKLPPGKRVYEYTMQMGEGSAIIAIQGGPTWRILVRPDNVPKIKIDRIGPNTTNKGALDIDYTAEDDYGIKQNELNVQGPKPKDGEKPLPSSKIPPAIIP